LGVPSLFTSNLTLLGFIIFVYIKCLASLCSWLLASCRWMRLCFFLLRTPGAVSVERCLLAMVMSWSFVLILSLLLRSRWMNWQHRSVDDVNYYDVWLSYATTNPSRTLPQTPRPEPDFDITQFRIKAQIKVPSDLFARTVITITPRRTGRRLLLFELSRLLQV